MAAPCVRTYNYHRQIRRRRDGRSKRLTPLSPRATTSAQMTDWVQVSLSEGCEAAKASPDRKVHTKGFLYSLEGWELQAFAKGCLVSLNSGDHSPSLGTSQSSKKALVSVAAKASTRLFVKRVEAGRDASRCRHFLFGQKSTPGPEDSGQAAGCPTRLQNPTQGFTPALHSPTTLSADCPWRISSRPDKLISVTVEAYSEAGRPPR